MQSPLGSSTKPELHPVPDARREGWEKKWDKRDLAIQILVVTVLYGPP